MWGRAVSQFTEVRRQIKTAARYRTDCKLCKLPIVWGVPTVWLTKPMGLSHEACV